jgi:hydroxyacylglutathione hydrolase
MKLLALRAFNDNYIWMLHDGRNAIVVDPGDSAPVLATLAAEHLTLAGILVTHHDADHVGGMRHLSNGVVHGPTHELIPPPFVALADGDRIDVAGQAFDVIDVPGHIADHIAYFHASRSIGTPILFCGDTLFSGGCGRLFEGTAAQMNASLHRPSSLPDDTRVCCAHEYTLANLRFAAAVDPTTSISQPTHALAKRSVPANRPHCQAPSGKRN